MNYAGVQFYDIVSFVFRTSEFVFPKRIMEASTDYFITLIECNRILYDKSSKDFKNVGSVQLPLDLIAGFSSLALDQVQQNSKIYE